MRFTLTRLREVISDIVISRGQAILLTRLDEFSYQINAITVLQIPKAFANSIRTLTIKYPYSLIGITKYIAGLSKLKLT